MTGNFNEPEKGYNSIPYSDFELYLAGFLPLDSVKQFDVFSDITWADSITGTFEAQTKTTFNRLKILEMLGPRNPAFENAQKEFNIICIMLTPAPLTDLQFNAFDEQVKILTNPKADSLKNYLNFNEATRGIARLNSDLSSAVILSLEDLSNAMQSMIIYPNPATNHITVHTNLAYYDHIRLYDMQGKFVRLLEMIRNSPESNIEISLEGIAKGSYLLEVAGENKRIIRPLYIISSN